jgi:hypothetical protein
MYTHVTVTKWSTTQYTTVATPADSTNALIVLSKSCGLNTGHAWPPMVFGQPNKFTTSLSAHVERSMDSRMGEFTTATMRVHPWRTNGATAKLSINPPSTK